MKRRIGAGVWAAVLWAGNPVSAEGSARSWRIVYELGGPEVLRSVEAMRAHEVGRRLLRERPDLGAVLDDDAALAAMPEGSLGRHYLAFTRRPGVIRSSMVAGAAYADGAFDRLAWSDEAKWLVDRMAHSHDLLHVLAGYGSDLAGEALLIAFTAGIANPLGIGRRFTEAFGAGSGLLLGPSVGLRRWRAAMGSAYRRGLAVRRHRPFYTHPFEDLLPLPLDRVREAIGIPHVRGGPFIDTQGWIDGWFARRYASGFGSMDRWRRHSEKSEALVRAGVPLRTLLSAPRRAQKEAWRLLRRGADTATLIAAVRAV